MAIKEDLERKYPGIRELCRKHDCGFRTAKQLWEQSRQKGTLLRYL